MAADDRLSATRIAQSVEDAGLLPLSSAAAEQFAAYFEILTRWNSRLNLTAIRDTEGILRRHFIECIFCAQNLPNGIGTLLDFGSGAGFPGIPIALCRPEIQVTLAESQNKKTSFLREVARTLGLLVEVYSGRVEELPPGRIFDAVSLRAVEKMQDAVKAAAGRVATSGWLIVLASKGLIQMPEGFVPTEIPIPGSNDGILSLAQRSTVPRET